MGIKGLTDRSLQRDAVSGRNVRLGTLQKGEREGFGKNVKLFDRDYFVFKPRNKDPQLADLFVEAYGDKPEVIPDIRIPVAIAGNFNIENCAWLTAAKHTQNGSVFMARSDGDNILQARNPETGRVQFYQEGELPIGKVSKVIDDKPHFVYGTSAYPWQQSMAIDLLLPHFNRLVFRQAVAGHGVVTLTTHSTYDIATLIGEYYAFIDEIVSLLSNPLRGDQETVRNYLPLRDFPLRLYRSTDTITTPNWRKNSDNGERMVGTRSLLHWQLAPEVAAAMQEAMDKRRDRLISAVANVPLLTTQQTVDETNDLLGLGNHDPEAKRIPAEITPEPDVVPDWDEIYDGDLVDAEDLEKPGTEPEPVDWIEQATEAENLDVFASATFQMFPMVFDTANQAKTAYNYMFGDFDPNFNQAAIKALELYASARADGVVKTEAIEAAKNRFADLRAWLDDDGADEEE